jgi:hypothetical protein
VPKPRRRGQDKDAFPRKAKEVLPQCDVSSVQQKELNIPKKWGDHREFLEVFDRELQIGGTKSSSFAEDLQNHAARTKGAPAYSQEEVQGFADYVNKSLKQDPNLKGLLPIGGLSDALFKAMHDGILLCKLCNLASPWPMEKKLRSVPLRTDPRRIFHGRQLRPEKMLVTALAFLR